MASYNKIQLTGKLSDAPDVKVTTSGHAISKFTMIVPRVEALPNQRFDYIRVTAWRDNADKTANYQKDDIIFVEGRILTDSYEDASSGQRKWTTEVEARQVVNFNDVFSSNESPATDFNPETDSSPPMIENIPKAPIDEVEFFKNSEAFTETKNELDEDVPF